MIIVKKITFLFLFLVFLQSCSEQENKAGSKACTDCLFQQGVERGTNRCDSVCGR